MQLNEIKKLSEAYNGDWAILPATMALYGKKVVDIQTAASEWDSCTIYVCSKEGRNRPLFVSSAGTMSGIKIGESYSTYHDQTGVSKGNYTVLNIVEFKDGEIVNSANDVGLTGKASLAVFK